MASSFDDTSRLLRIAFVCPSISGHANVHLASLHHLLSLASPCPPLQLHLISEAPLRTRVTSLLPSHRHTVSFHELRKECYWQSAAEGDVHERRHGPPRPFTEDGRRAFDVVRRAVTMPVNEYMSYYVRALDILREINPNITVVDVLMAAGPVGDACTTAGIQYGVLSPIPSLDFVRMARVSLKNVWKYPAYVDLWHYS
jgi:hypothetical protein